MKKVFWWILGILLSPVLLFAMLTVLLYLPPVQNWAVDKVASVASEKLGMQISVGHVDLSFPLDLEIDRFLVAQPSADSLATSPDTIADVERMVVDVQLLPLLDSRVVINQLEVTRTRLNTSNLVDAAQVRGDVGRLSLASRGIDLDQQSVALNGARLEDARLDVQLRDSVPEDTTTTETLWRIDVDSIVVSRSSLVLHMPGDTMSVAARFGTLTARQALIDLGTQTYTVGSVDWLNGALRYDQNFEPRIEGLDYNHLDLTDIHIGIDSIYYHDPTLRLFMRETAFKEKSGLQLTDLHGAVAMENGSVRLPRFRLKTPDSDIFVEMDMPLSLMDAKDPGRLDLRMNAQIGRKDLMMFLADAPQPLRDRWPYYPLTVSGAVKGNMQHLEFNDLTLELPTAFSATATGYAYNVDDPQRLRGDVTFSGRTQNLGFVMAMLPRDMQRNYRLPPMSAEGRIKADGTNFLADVTAREGSGTVVLNGTLNTDAMRYDGQLSVRNLNVNHFMPRDSIYTVTADISVDGHGTDIFSPDTRLMAYAAVSDLHYKRWHFSDITCQTYVRRANAVINVESRNEMLSGRILMDALLNREKLIANVEADINRADLYAMGLMEKPLSLGLCGEADIKSDMKQTHWMSGLISEIYITDEESTFRSPYVGLHMNLTPDTTIVRAQSGDLVVKIDTNTDYEHLTQQFVTLGDSLLDQFDRKVIDQPALKRLLPTLKIHVESKADNPIADMLRTGQGIEFRDLSFDMSTSAATGVNGSGHMHSLVVSDVRLDTLNFNINQRRERITFGGQIRNNKKNPQFVFNALFDGVVQERGATFGVRYYDAAGQLGARLGAQAEMVDSGINLHLIPARPTLGYKEFNLNKDNFVLLTTKGKVEAKVDFVADDGTGLKIYSDESDSTARQDLTVSLNKINLDEVTSVIPYAPRMTGLMNGDFHVIQDEGGRFSVVSDMDVRNMTYERSPIGNISSEMVYLQKGDTAHAVEARIMMDDEEIGLLTGTYYDKGEGSIDAKVLLERLPLSLANGFVPDQMFGMEGYSVGELDVRGPMSRLLVDGEVKLDSAYLVSVPYGVRMRFAQDPVFIKQSRLNFNNYLLYSSKNDELNVHGTVDFAELDHIMVNVRLRAQNYQVIDAKENRQSVAFGKAFVNLFARLSGTLDNITMRGRFDVLGTTDMSYILRDTPLSTDNQLDELVRFTDFSDSTQTVVERPALTGFKMDMTLNVSNGAHIMAYMNADHSNYIDLMGGGTLRMTYSPADDLRLTGRYTLSNGEMKYSLPVIPLKTFTIQDGSYIEFTGDMMNPTLNITATERTKASVATDGGVGRTVEFDCGVIITQTLSNMGLEFTLDAPEDMQLHSELQAMTVDQRGKQAVAMLTTGMYLSDGNTGSFSMNSALSSFLNSQINQISGSALRTLDLSFGMDNSTDATGETHTDYSFKFAKRFWGNRLKVAVGGKVSTGAEIEQRNNSFFDNVSLEYRLDDTANKYVSLFFQNNSYDWLDGYTQKYGGGFIWRRTMDRFLDIFRLKETTTMMPMRTMNMQQTQRTLPADTLRKDSLKTQVHEAK